MAELAASPRKEKFCFLSRFAPSPTLADLHRREKMFVLDCVAVESISKDYSVSLPKLGSVIPPYNAQKDRHVHGYFISRPVPPLLRRTGQSHGGTSTLGDLADRFQHKGAAALYLLTRNGSGSGHSTEHTRGHGLFLSSVKPVIGYNGLYGYRRNTPSLRRMPSPFGLVTKSAIY
ncbi:sperm microtubule associated protein 1-like [Eleutherodactylus coqui]|uniref:sperm microtubule associated protein 1-like n=1 Tax=Eleutherodactylus coqui TaxID=57060 RepID=UPI003461AE56